MQSDCAKLGDELGRTVPSVTFVARDAKGTDLPDTQVFVDGTLAQSRLDEGKPYDLDPGKHAFRFSHAGKDVTMNVVVSSGEKSRAIVATFADANGGAPAPASLRTTPPPDAERGSRSAVPLVVAGVGGAAMIVGGALLVTGLRAVPSNCSRSTMNEWPKALHGSSCSSSYDRPWRRTQSMARSS